MTLNYTTRQLMDHSRWSPTLAKMVHEELAGLDSRISAMDGAGEIPIENLEDASGSGMIIVTDGDKSPAYVQMTGDASISNAGAVSLSDNSVEQANMSDDSIGVAELKIVERDITIDGGAAIGSVTNAEDIDGVVIGVIPSADCETPIKNVSFATDTGAITVELMSAQSAGVPATVTAVVLQA